MRVYRSIEDIDRDLEIYKLQSQIEKEKINRSFFLFKDSVSPVKLGASLVSTVTKKVLYGKLLTKILPFMK